MGKINVANSVYWGAQTERSLNNFKIGGPQARMPIEIIRGTYVMTYTSAIGSIRLGSAAVIAMEYG
jgi:fumarate hydratase class II